LGGLLDLEDGLPDLGVSTVDPCLLGPPGNGFLLKLLFLTRLSAIFLTKVGFLLNLISKYASKS